jgi:hypothetical protein
MSYLENEKWNRKYSPVDIMSRKMFRRPGLPYWLALSMLSIYHGDIG